MAVTVEIVKRFSFEAAHQLLNHDGRCRNLHGHSYVVELGITGPVSTVVGAPDEGMVMDFGVVSAVFREHVFAVVDHQNLNEVLDVLVPVTTAENIAVWILGVMTAVLPRPGRVSFVRVWETVTAYAEARP